MKIKGNIFLLYFIFLGLLLLQTCAWAEVENKKVLVDGTSLHYIREGNGVPVVMIHGTYSSLNIYKLSIFDDVAKHYETTAFDLPGYGESGRPRLKMTYNDRVEMIHAAIKKLGIKKPILVGHSSGGAFSLRYALKYPNEVRALALISPYTEPYEKADTIYRTTTTPVIGDLFFYLILKPVQLLRNNWKFAKPGFSPNPVNREYATKEVGLALRRKTFRANANDVETLGPALVEMENHYGEIKVPVVIITGEEDPISVFKTNGEILHKKITQSQLILLPETGHNPLFIKTKEVLEAIDTAAQAANSKS